MEIGPLVGQRLLAVDPSAVLAEVARRMQDRNVGAAIVSFGNGDPGIVTERDLLRAVADGVDLAHMPVLEYMTTAPICADASCDVVEAARMMLRGGFRHLIVLDNEARMGSTGPAGAGAMMGVLSIRDLLDALLEEREAAVLPWGSP